MNLPSRPAQVLCIGAKVVEGVRKECGAWAPWGSFLCDTCWAKLPAMLKTEIIEEKRRIKTIKSSKPSKPFLRLLERAVEFFEAL